MRWPATATTSRRSIVHCRSDSTGRHRPSRSTLPHGNNNSSSSSSSHTVPCPTVAPPLDRQEDRDTCAVGISLQRIVRRPKRREVEVRGRANKCSSRRRSSSRTVKSSGHALFLVAVEVAGDGSSTAFCILLCPVAISPLHPSTLSVPVRGCRSRLLLLASFSDPSLLL